MFVGEIAMAHCAVLEHLFEYLTLTCDLDLFNTY